jgi:phosphoribosylglycinamide formyltransferase-1
MFGMNVHKKVIDNKEVESGITIHYVSENYDEGQIIEQHKCEVLLCDTPEILAKKISLLERDYFPKCIKKLLI